MAEIGSQEYALTWKRWDIALGPPICALRASGRRTSGKDCSGWPTASVFLAAGDPAKVEARKAECMERHGNNGFGMNLAQTADQVTGYPTTTTRDYRGLDDPNGPRMKRKLAQGWTIDLNDTAGLMVGYATPNAWDSQGSYGGGGQGASLRTDAQEITHGNRVNSAAGPTEPRGALNPELARWLMGFPAGWGSYAGTVTRSSRKSPRNSSRRIWKLLG